MTAKPFLFGIGPEKSGGHSLAEALCMMGYCVKHLGHEEANGRPELLKRFLENKQSKKPLLDGMSGLDGLVDYPVCECFEALDNEVPSAKFVMTYRPPDDIAISWCRMIAAQHARVGAGWVRHYNKELDKAVMHYTAVQNHFFGRPNKLLVLDMRDSDTVKWRLLARFLGRPAPANAAYPHAFSHTEWDA